MTAIRKIYNRGNTVYIDNQTAFNTDLNPIPNIDIQKAQAYQNLEEHRGENNLSDLPSNEK